jgi:hypothetical protein
MIYTLMHKKIPVADININTLNSGIDDIIEIYNKKHLPPGTITSGNIDGVSLNQWWELRGIPASRQGLREALDLLGIPNKSYLIEKGLGLSLSDQYWIRPKETELKWDAVNFFKNDFSDDVGEALFGKKPRRKPADFFSPDSASSGNLRKKWIIAGDKRLLVKGGSGPYYQEPLNEVIASSVLERLGIPHITYTLMFDRDKPLSVCEDFINENTELIPAWQIMNSFKIQSGGSEYRHYIRCCDALKIPDAGRSLDQMIAGDFLLVNTDRHYNNFGAIRNAETLEWLGCAPVYDNGNSLWFNEQEQLIKAFLDADSRPFRSYHSQQIGLVRSFDWLNIKALDAIDRECEQILSKSAVYINKARRDIICSGLKTRVEMLERVSFKKIQELKKTNSRGGNFNR